MTTPKKAAPQNVAQAVSLPAPAPVAPDDHKTTADERKAAKAAEDAVTNARMLRGYHTGIAEGVQTFICDHDGFTCYSEEVLLDHLQAIGK